jgi:hypothetical protein
MPVHADGKVYPLLADDPFARTWTARDHLQAQKSRHWSDGTPVTPRMSLIPGPPTSVQYNTALATKITLMPLSG